MKKLLLALVVFSLAMVLLPSPVMAGTWSLTTDLATDNSYFWATLNGRVTAINSVSTVYAGFVWDTVSHDDPGTTEPGASDYYYAQYIDDVHNTPFSFYVDEDTYGGAFLLPNTPYYYRSCVRFGAPNNVWDYGPEEVLLTPQNPEGTWGVYGVTPAVYLQLTTDNLSSENYTAGTGTLNATVEWMYDTCSLDTFGFVVDNVTHANPSGWPGAWADLAPGASDYADYYEADGMGHTDDNFTYSYAVSGWVPGTTYYVRAVADITAGGGDWVYGPEYVIIYADCSHPTLIPPSNLVATPVTGTEIDLTWWSANGDAWFSSCGGGQMWPNLLTVIRMEAWEYPDDPPSITDNSTIVYQAKEKYGSSVYAVTGLTPGTTYYFRIWFYDSEGIDGDPAVGWTDYDEDFATPYAGTEPPEDVDVPPNWFTDPTCDSWENVPGAMVVINGIETDYGLPHNTLCLFINLFLLSCAMTTSFGGMAIATRRPTGTQTIMVPFIVMCAGFIIGPVIGAFPGFFLAIGVIIGIGVAFAWSRA